MAYRKGYITREELIALAQPMLKAEYRKYLIINAIGKPEDLILYVQDRSEHA